MTISDNVATQDRRRIVTVTIAKNGSLSSAVDLVGCRVVALQMPSAWTAADITFQASHDNSTFADLYDSSGNEKTLTVDAGRYVYLAPDDFLGVRYLKVRSGASGAAVSQDDARTVTLVVTG